jgi:hypothetical protein
MCARLDQRQDVRFIDYKDYKEFSDLIRNSVKPELYQISPLALGPVTIMKR